jgi:hypothetical protein
MGVSFDLNDTVVKIGRAFNTRRNTRLRDKCRKTEPYSKTGYIVHLLLEVYKAKKVLINVESKGVIATKLTGSGAVCRDPVECIVRQSFLLFNFFNLDV